jgi:hypothetical protein
VLIRFNIAIRFTELVENPLYTGPYNLKKADWSRFRNRLKQFATPVLTLYYNQNSWTNDKVNLLVKEMQGCIQKVTNQSIPLMRQLLLLLLLYFNKCM